MRLTYAPLPLQPAWCFRASERGQKEENGQDDGGKVGEMEKEIKKQKEEKF